jgi:probable O-glycosylation ligase (exosortase A-associated)
VLRNIFVLGIVGVGLAYAVRAPFYSLLLYLWIAYFRPDQWVWSDFISSLSLSFFVGAWTILMTLFSKEKFPFNGRVALIALFVLQALVSTLFAANRETAWSSWVDFLKWNLMAYVIVVTVTDAARFRAVLLVIGVSLGFEAAKQGWVTLVLHPGATNINELPMLGDNNGVAVGMLMLVPILTLLASTATSTWERWLHRFLAVGVLYRALTTYSRGGFLACLALAILYALRSTKRVRAMAGIVVAAAIIVPTLPDAFWDRMNTINAPASQGLEGDPGEGRFHFWSVAVKMANDYPLFGVGFNAFNDNYDAYDDTHGLYGPGRSVHSAWFGVLAELGYPGLILFVLQILLAFGACRRARRASRGGKQFASLGQFAFALEAGLVVFMVGGTFLPFQYVEMVWHWFALTIALDALARTALASAAVPVSADAARSSASALAGWQPAVTRAPAAARTTLS